MVPGEDVVEDIDTIVKPRHGPHEDGYEEVLGRPGAESRFSIKEWARSRTDFKEAVTEFMNLIQFQTPCKKFSDLLYNSNLHFSYP